MSYFCKLRKPYGLLKHTLTVQRCKHTAHKAASNLSYYYSVGKTQLTHETIGQRLMHAADSYGDREAFVFYEDNERLTFSELKKSAEDIACGLLAIGLKRGDRLGIWASNRVEWILTQFATALIGVILVNVNPAYRTHELEYSLHKVGCKALVMNDKFKTQNYVEMLTDICPEFSKSKPGHLNSKRLPMLKSAIVLGSHQHHGMFSFDQLKNSSDSSHRETLDKFYRDLQASDAINIQYTSGTTGSPKAATLTHHMILNNVAQINRLLEYSDNKRTSICLPVPLYHCFGMVLGSLATITNGITAVFPSRVYNPTSNLKAISAEKCTSFYGTPTMYIDLLTHPELKQHDVSSLSQGLMSGSTCPVEVVNDAANDLNMKNIVVIYGMTETSPVITASSVHDSFENRTQTIGKPMETLECKVVDEHHRLVPFNTPGQLLARGYNIMQGYWGDKEKTEETMTPDRYIKTGDLVSMNEHGFMKHLGRLKDLIIRGGENVYPRELEDFFHEHHKIADVYIVGVPDKRMGEEICACIKLEAGEKMTPDEVRAFCKDMIAHFKIPKYVEFMDEFPLTVTGKVQKNILREKMMRKLGLEKK